MVGRGLMVRVVLFMVCAAVCRGLYLGFGAFGFGFMVAFWRLLWVV